MYNHKIRKLLFLTVVFFASVFQLIGQTTTTANENSVYQYSVLVGDRRAYLWIPPASKYVRGIIISLSNLLERKWLEDPIVRKTASDENVGIIWVGPGKSSLFTAEMNPGAGEGLLKMFKDFANESGYKELENAPIISMGHSANGHFSWNVPNWNAARTIAAIPVKTVPFPASFKFKNVPVCYVVGQTTEWPQFRVPDPATKPGDRDFFWPVVREKALALRSADENNLVSVVTDPGGGHFDWDENQSKFIALFIKKACQYRLPKKSLTTGLVKLNLITKESGWLTDAGGIEPDKFAPATYNKYKGDPKKAYWFFDEETAKAAVAFNGDRKNRERQMLTFVQDGRQLPVAKLGFAPLKFEPQNDGLTFNLEGAFLSEMPKELIGAGSKLGHAPGPIKFRVITGPAIQTGANTFRVQFDRGGMGGEIWLQEEHPGDNQYRRAVQPGQIKIPAKLTVGKTQMITFPHVEDKQAGTKLIELKATSDSGLPINYYVVSGPAIIDGNILKLTKIPVNSKYPVKVTVVAYQWGRTVEPLYQSAEPITQEFFITKQ